MSSNRTLYGTISATAPYGDSITQLNVKFTPEQSSTPSLMPETNSVYLTRPTEGTGELMELVGGSVAWNQLAIISTTTGTVYGITRIVSGGSVTYSGNASSTTNYSCATASPFTSGHKWYITLGNVILPSGCRLSLASVDKQTEGIFLLGTGGSSFGVYITSGFDIGNFTVTPMAIDLTACLGSTIADYVYSLEQATAGSGIAWLKSYGFFTEDYYAYSAPTLQSVEATSHIAKDGNGNVISTTTFGSVTLRGMLKTDADGNLYYDGDTYEWDGTVNRRFAEVALSDLTWTLSGQAASNFTAVVPDKAYRSGNVNLFICDKYELSTASLSSMANKSIRGRTDNNRIYVQDNSYADAASFSSAVTGSIIYELATQTTESADPYTAVQTVEDGGTEEFVTTNNVPVGVVGRFANAVPMEGVDSFSVTANDGTSHTYPVTLSEEIYRGYVDMLTGEAVSDMASIAEYNGETISEPWLSSLDEYAAGTTPTNGAQVVYPITPEEVTATITGDPTELGEVTSVTSTKGTVKWGNMMPLGLKAEITIDSPF